MQVVENPIINQVVFEGNSNIKDDKLQDEVTVRPRGIFTKAKVEDDVQPHRRALPPLGPHLGDGDAARSSTLPQKRVDLIFEINEGPKSGILRHQLPGQQALLGQRPARRRSSPRKATGTSSSSSNDNYDPDRIDYDQEQLRKFYRNRGYYDFRIVIADRRAGAGQERLRRHLHARRGPRVQVRQADGEHRAEEAERRRPARSCCRSAPGQLYQDEKIEQATDALTFAAGAAGFAFVDVRPHYTPIRANHTVDVTFDVKEGPRVYVERIDIVGNTETLDYVIRRELLLSEGDAYNRVLVDRSKNQVKALGFFKDVDITTDAGQRAGPHRPAGQGHRAADRRALVQRRLFDRSTSWWPTSASPSATSAAAARTCGPSVSIGSIRQQLDLSFTEPRFLGRDLSAGFDLYAYRYDFTQYAGYSQRLGRRRRARRLPAEPST